MTNNLDYQSHKSYYGSGSDEYNFDVDLMKDSSDLLNLIKQAKECEEGIENGAVLLVTEKQCIVAYNRGMGNGPHDSTIARLYSLLTDQKELGFFTVKSYCRKAEECLLIGRIYAEKETKMSKVSKILAFSLDSGKISPKMFSSFMAFYDEYAWAIKRENFKVAFRGRDMTLDEVKERLESMIDYDYELKLVTSEPVEEKIIGVKTNEEEKKIGGI